MWYDNSFDCVVGLEVSGGRFDGLFNQCLVVVLSSHSCASQVPTSSFVSYMSSLKINC